MIELIHLRKEYETVTPLADVNAVIRDGDVISVIGPSGTGKSTLLRCINRLESPTSGRILVDGVDVTDPKCDLRKVRQRMGMVFQSFNLFGHLTAIENLMLAPVDLLGKSRQEAYDEGMRLLYSVGLAEKASAYPDELSGGQKQRVAIARALAMGPDTVLLDEPTSALDPTMVGEVQAVIRELAKMGKTMMIVTHDLDFAREISSRVFYMDEGVIYEDGTPEQVFTAPLREKTRRFIQKRRVLELDIRSRSYDFPGAQSEIGRYCERNQIPRRMTRHIQLAFEELVQQLLLPALASPDIGVTLEYAQDTEQTEMLLRYGGAALDVTAEPDALPLLVLKSAVDNLRYDHIPDTERGNRLRARILP